MKKTKILKKHISKSHPVRIKKHKKTHLKIKIAAVVASFALVGLVMMNISFGASSTKNLNSRGLNGQVAIDALGRNIKAAATKNKLSEAKLRQKLLSDSNLTVDNRLNLFYADPINPLDASKSYVNGVTPGAGSFNFKPLINTFSLHSKPGMTRKIYLDFDGNVTKNSYWNTDPKVGPELVSAPFDIDNNSATFNDNEKYMIQEIWSRVADDYAPYQVDVTTQDPGVESLTKSSNSDTSYGIRVIVSNTAWFGDFGGVSYLNVFSSPVEIPNFVFATKLGSNASNIAEAASHEVGHAVGLSHDGAGKESYYRGSGNWAPIMGVGYGKTTTQFSKGEYLLATNNEDDLNLIQTYIPLESDSVGNNISSAKDLTIANGNVNDSGLIEYSGDTDYYRFTGGGQINLTVTPNTMLGFVSPNLDARISLYDGNSKLITQSDPAGTATASISLNISDGTYLLVVEGVGYLTPDTGYSNYASLGNYSISGNVGAANNKPPTANFSFNPATGNTPLTVSFTDQSSDPEGQPMTYYWEFKNGQTGGTKNTIAIFFDPGTYAVTLTVKDIAGATASITKNITVNKKPLPSVTYTIYPPTLKKTNLNNENFADTTISAIGFDGKPIAGTTITGTWSGMYSASVTGTTNSQGQIYFRTPKLTGNGVQTFTVNASPNIETATTNYVWDSFARTAQINLSLPPK